MTAAAVEAPPQELQLNGVAVADTFAEAFGMSAARVIITAHTQSWAETAAREMSGYASSVIACNAEIAIERVLPANETPDGRPGVSVLAFAFSRDGLASALQGRIGQCVLTCPTTACFNGILDCPKEKRISVGGAIRYFGDGFQSSKKLGTRRFWRLPVMDGEFLCEDKFGSVTGIGGGNLLICGETMESALTAAERAVAAIATIPDVILPFPGGIVRSGSKVGSRYKKLKASTNDTHCPTLRGLVNSELPAGCGAVYEIVIDGLSHRAVQLAMKQGLYAAVKTPGILKITAGNYGGKLGKHHFALRDLLD